MKQLNLNNAGKGEYVSPSCILINMEPASVICASGEIEDLGAGVLIEDTIWDIW